jgi:hypothetical protein
MAIQTRYLLEVADVVALRLQCRNENCETSLIIDLDEETGNLSSLANNNVLTVCPGCGFPWMEQGRMTVDTEIKNFLRQIKDARKLEDKFGFSLRFELKAEREPTTVLSLSIRR